MMTVQEYGDVEVFLEQQAQATAIWDQKIRAGKNMSEQIVVGEIKVSLDGHDCRGNAKPALAIYIYTVHMYIIYVGISSSDSRIGCNSTCN